MGGILLRLEITGMSPVRYLELGATRKSTQHYRRQRPGGREHGETES